MILTRGQIVGCVDLKTCVVEVPEWGGEVRLRELNLAERERWSREAIDPGTGKLRTDASLSRCMAAMCVAMLVDDTGAAFYSDAERETGIAELQAKNADVLQRLFDAALSLNDMRADDVERSAKNLPTPLS